VTLVDFSTSTSVFVRRELADATALVKLRRCVLYRRLAYVDPSKVSKTAEEIGIRSLACYMYLECRGLTSDTVHLCQLNSDQAKSQQWYKLDRLSRVSGKWL
jgi:hypothetical protein